MRNFPMHQQNEYGKRRHHHPKPPHGNPEPPPSRRLWIFAAGPQPTGRVGKRVFLYSDWQGIAWRLQDLVGKVRRLGFNDLGKACDVFGFEKASELSKSVFFMIFWINFVNRAADQRAFGGAAAAVAE